MSVISAYMRDYVRRMGMDESVRSGVLITKIMVRTFLLFPKTIFSYCGVLVSAVYCFTASVLVFARFRKRFAADGKLITRQTREAHTIFVSFESGRSDF